MRVVVAPVAAEHGLPCLVIAGQVALGRRDMADAAAQLTFLAARVAKQWSPGDQRVP